MPFTATLTLLACDGEDNKSSTAEDFTGDFKLLRSKAAALFTCCGSLHNVTSHEALGRDMPLCSRW